MRWTRPRPPAATSGVASRRRSWWSRPTATGGRRWSRCTSRTTRSRSPSCAGWSSCSDAYALAGEADELVNEGRQDEAARLYEQAGELAPGSHELRFWAGLGAAQAGDLERGVADVRQAVAVQPGWRTLFERLPADVAPSARAVLARLRADE